VRARAPAARKRQDDAGLAQRLAQALEQEAATSRILHAMARSPADVQPVADAIANAALDLCRASSAVVFTFDGELLHIAALASVHPSGAEALRSVFPRPPSRDTAATRAALTARIEVIPDVLCDAEYGIKGQAMQSSFRSTLSVPLLRDGRVIGVVGVGRPEPGPFSEEQISMLKTFADQGVIAIENARLFQELAARNRDVTDALAQQTATSEILRVISGSPTDVQPVFDLIAERAVKLCDADVGVVSRVDGPLIALAALYGVNPKGVAAIGRAFPMKRDQETITARAVRSRSIVHVADVLAEPGYATAQAARIGRFRGALGVPMTCEGEVIGAIFLGRSRAGLFSDRQVELLKTFADQAVIAVQNARLFGELDTRTQQLTRSVRELQALGEVGRVLSSTLDLERVLNTIASRATELTGMEGASIFEYDETREEFSLHTAYGVPDEVAAALRTTHMRKGEGALGRLALTPEPVQIVDIADEASYQSRVRSMLMRRGWRSLLAVPLLRESRLLGGLVVNRSVPGAFPAEVIELLKTFATQSALAIQNARLFRELEQKSRELESASRHKSEFLANMSHELRTPLNAIIGFSEVLAERMFGDVNEKQAEYLGDILESARHLLSLINDILDLSKIEAGRMELEAASFDLPAAIDNTLILVRERAQRRTIDLARSFDDRLGAVVADERKVKQVLLNLLSNALKFTPEGGRIDVSARARDGVAEIAVHDTGIGIAAADQQTVFEEFRQVGAATKKAEGTGLGLAISRKFIELHGGRIWVESEPGAGSTFTFTLPLKPGAAATPRVGRTARAASRASR
jgi:signal transduction histidine kinase/putative methionine-R-sulfoxide reductase with GAF domain